MGRHGDDCGRGDRGGIDENVDEWGPHATIVYYIMIALTNTK